MRYAVHAQRRSITVCAPVAQGIERLPPEQKAAGSIPAGGTTWPAVMWFRARFVRLTPENGDRSAHNWSRRDAADHSPRRRHCDELGRRRASVHRQFVARPRDRRAGVLPCPKHPRYTHRDPRPAVQSTDIAEGRRSRGSKVTDMHAGFMNDRGVLLSTSVGTLESRPGPQLGQRRTPHAYMPAAVAAQRSQKMLHGGQSRFCIRCEIAR